MTCKRPGQARSVAQQVLIDRGEQVTRRLDGPLRHRRRRWRRRRRGDGASDLRRQADHRDRRRRARHGSSAPRTSRDVIAARDGDDTIKPGKGKDIVCGARRQRHAQGRRRRRHAVRPERRRHARRAQNGKDTLRGGAGSDRPGRRHGPKPLHRRQRQGLASSCELLRDPPPNLSRAMDLARLDSFIAERGEPAYRADQVREWAARGAAGYEEMTNLPAALRAELERGVPFSTLERRRRGDLARRHPQGALRDRRRPAGRGGADELPRRAPLGLRLLAVGLPAHLHLLRDRVDALRPQPRRPTRSSTRSSTSAAAPPSTTSSSWAWASR